MFNLKAQISKLTVKFAFWSGKVVGRFHEIADRVAEQNKKREQKTIDQPLPKQEKKNITLDRL